MTARRLALALLGLLVSAVATWLVLRSVDVSAALGVLGRASPLPLVAAVLVVGVEVTLRGLRWRALLPRRPDGARPPLGRVTAVLLVGYLGNLVLPARLGEAIRAYLIARRDDLRLPATLGSVVLERIIDTATLAVMALGAAALVGAPAWILQIALLVAVLAGLIVAFLAIVGIGPFVRGAEALLTRRGSRPSRLTGLLRPVQLFGESVGGRERRPVIALAAAISIATWLLDGLIFMLIGSALGLSIPLPAAFLISAITTLSTVVPSAPGYVGTFELAAVSAAVALGVDADSALALALVAHAVTVLPVAGAGAVCVTSVAGGMRRVAAEAQRAVRSGEEALSPP